MEVGKISIARKLIISPKQREILKVLEDKTHTEIFAGGAAL